MTINRIVKRLRKSKDLTLRNHGGILEHIALKGDFARYLPALEKLPYARIESLLLRLAGLQANSGVETGKVIRAAMIGLCYGNRKILQDLEAENGDTGSD